MEIWELVAPRKIKVSPVVAIGDTVKAVTLTDDAQGMLQVLNMVVPTLTGGVTATLTIEDDAALVLYNSGAKGTGTTTFVNDPATFKNIPIIKGAVVRITLSGTQAGAITVALSLFVKA